MDLLGMVIGDMVIGLRYYCATWESVELVLGPRNDG